MREIATDIDHVLLTWPLPPAPSAAPDPVTVTGVTSSSITVQWGEVECIGRNGEITGYSVRYDELGGDHGITQTMSASGDFSGGVATIYRLSPATMYKVLVAAKSRAGTGDYSDPVRVLTSGTHACIYFGASRSI